MKAAATIPELVAARAAADPSAPALLAPGREPLTYESLARQVESAAAALAGFGVERTSRVALALSDGPDAATAFLAAAAAGIAAPLNPRYVAAEFASRLESLEASALVVEEAGESEAAAAARKLGVPVLALRPAREAGAFALFDSSGAPPKPENPRPPGPSDIALLLATSGTTARPKLVPLTHANLLASARAVAETLALSPADRGLCVMPLFHIHGLVAALLAPLVSGGSVVCPPGFHPIDFFSWLESFRPSWFTAVPSMHQALLARAGDHREAVAASRLRFIRSSSAALAPSLLADLERAFAAPVVESYGMTEAAHQMASNPLEGVRKPGTVGRAAGPEIAILDGNGSPLGPNETGEVAIRGPNVTSGYLGNEAANREAFANGWFRTGDLGVMDADGYLTLIGRIKEIINRGGEKVAPREVEEALLAHPDVAEAAAFPVPDEALGEEVGAAVVLKPGARADASALKEFAAQRLAYFKLPRHLAVVDAIPKGATGKVQRALLAERLGIAAAPRGAGADATAPRNETESLLCALWREVLRVETFGIHASFLDLGGDSILAAQLVARLRETLGLPLTMADIWDTPTVAEMAARIAKKQTAAKPAPIPRRGPGEPVPLSFSQEWWLSLDDMFPASPASNRPSSVLIEGALDVGALERAFSALIARHEALRMSFPRQANARGPRIEPPARIALSRRDLSALAPAEALARARDEAAALARAPFALDAYPLWRTLLLRVGGDAHVLAFVVHHALFDGWSMAVFVRELAALYEAFARAAPPLPELPVQYGDVAIWQRREIAGARLAALEEFWKKSLEGAPRPPAFPFARPRPKTPSFRGGAASLSLAPPLASQLRRLARSQRATLYMTLLAVFHCLMARDTGSSDVVTGCLVAGRERPECESLIGLFFNALALRGDMTGDPSARALVARTRDRTLAAFAHQDMPIARLAALAPRPAPGESPIALVPVLFQLRNLPRARAGGGGVTFSEFKVENEHARFDLTFDVSEEKDSLRCDLAFNADIFEKSDAEKLLSDFAALCAAFADTPDLPISRLAPSPGSRP